MSGYAQWSPFTTYILNDIVYFDGLIYISIQDGNLNHQPNSSPTWWASNGGGSTITSISGGAGISVSGSTAITITNTGVRTLASGGTGITIGGTTTDRTVSNTGVLTLTAGTNCSLGGTAQNPIVNTIATSTNPVRNTTRQTLSYTIPDPPSTGYVLNNTSPANPQTVFTITLPSAYTGCNNFTFYIGALSTTASTTSGVALNFLIYPSNTLNGGWSFLEGAMDSSVSTANPSSTTTNTLNNVVWNWTPTGGLTSNKIYINVASYTNTSPATTTTMTALSLDYDIVGSFATLT